ncbi:hypothetical protein F2Q68_00016680 [Brassica cretica]|uniref:Uncharacterized protein n=1 Tax=Brassica cretica TaxID=69181 RepID=A0A8S9HDZ7_BRACR|nr:hypothetical protein F2Q68_00016680 [Brassica cretica]
MTAVGKGPDGREVDRRNEPAVKQSHRLSSQSLCGSFPLRGSVQIRVFAKSIQHPSEHYIRQYNKHVPYCLGALFGSKTDPYTPSLLSSCFPSILSSQLDQILNRIPLFLSHSANHPHMTQVNKERRLGLQPAIQNRQYASLASVPEPVPDHIRISQYTVGSTALKPVSPPHGLPSNHPGPVTHSLEPCTSVHYPIQPILLQPFLFSMPPVQFASSQYDQSHTILLYRPYPKKKIQVLSDLSIRANRISPIDKTERPKCSLNQRTSQKTCKRSDLRKKARDLVGDEDDYGAARNGNENSQNFIMREERVGLSLE